MTEWLLLVVAAPTGMFVALAAWLDWRGGSLPSAAADAIVVAGCRVMPDGRPSPALARRVELAAALFRAGRAERLLLTGGLGADAPISEARASADLALALGVPPEALILEERSRDTLENAAFAARAWEDATGVRADRARILVVTDRSHVFRAARMFGARFGEVVATGATPPWRSRVRMALREGASVVHHGLRGRLSRGRPLGRSR